MKKNDFPENVVLMYTSCPMGCLPGDEFILKGQDRLHNLPGEFTVVRCNTCGLMRTNPRPTPESIGFYYPEDYRPYITTRISLANDIKRSSLSWKRLVKRLIKLDESHLPPLQPGNLLEIGCASGAFMHKMATAGWKVTGVEFSSKAAEAAKSLGYPVYTGPIESAPDLGGPFDLVVAWMVLEHLHEPLLALRKLRQWTHPNGMLVASVPNANTIEFRFFKENWYALHLPNHLYHYTPKTLSMLLEKGGWQIERVIHHNNPVNLLRSLSFVCSDRNLHKLSKYFLSLAKGEKARIIYIFLGFLLGVTHQSGRITVWARPIK